MPSTGRGGPGRAALVLAIAVAVGSGAAGDEPAPYRVVDGRADAATYEGYRRYHAGCNHCHGPDGSGSSFGPSLVERPLPLPEFRRAVLEGRASPGSSMRGMAGDPNVAGHVDAIWAYLRARADGALGRGRPQRLE